MKKINFIIGLLLAFCVTAKAESYSLLGPGIRAIYVTNTIAVTNFNAPTSTGTNLAGSAFTNKAGNLQVVVTSAGSTNVNLLGSVKIPFLQGVQTIMNNTNASTLAQWLSPYNVSVKLAGGSGANSAVQFTFVPSWDGVNLDTSTAFDWTFGVTATTTTTVVTATNVPIWRWQGAQSLHLVRVVNANTNASSQVIITGVNFNTPDNP